MEKYVAYVSTYTMGDSHGIRIYDVDMEKGRFMEKDKVEITNSSYISISHDRKVLYSMTMKKIQKVADSLMLMMTMKRKKLLKES